MREIIGALALALLTMPQLALAQATPWTDPTASFSLTLPDGWEILEREPDDVVRVGPPGDQPPLRECKVTVVAGRHDQASQEILNTFVESWDEARMLAPISDQQPRVVRYSNKAVDGVQVASLVIDFPYGVRMYNRRFGLARGGRVAVYNLYCGISDSADEADRRRVEALVASLAFIPAVEKTP